MQELEEKDKKLVEYKKQCDKINQQKAQAAADGQKKKEEIIAKFDKIIKQNKEIEPETIKELFPEDEELYNRVKEMKEKQKQEEKKISEDNKSSKEKKEENSKSEEEGNSADAK